MNSWHRRLVNFFLGFVLSVATGFAAGFRAGTSVKVPGGYTNIENLKVGDKICSRNDQGEEEVSVVSGVMNSCPAEIALISCAEQVLITSPEQRLFAYDLETHVPRWFPAEELTVKHKLFSIPRPVVNYCCNQRDNFDQIVLYNLTVAGTHNYFVTKQDIVAHNFFIIIPFLSFAFGAGSTITGLLGSKILLDTLIATCFLALIECYSPGSTAGYEFTSKEKMWQVQGQGKERGGFFNENLDQKCRQVPTDQEARDAWAKNIVAEAQRRQQAEDAQARANWTPAQSVGNWFTRAPAWWKKKLFGGSEPSTQSVQDEIAKHYQPPPAPPVMEHPAVTQLAQDFKKPIKLQSLVANAASAPDTQALVTQITQQNNVIVDDTVKNYIVQEAYDHLYSIGKDVSNEQQNARLVITKAIQNLQQAEIAYADASNKQQRDFALALAQKAEADLASSDPYEVKHALIMAEVCGAICDKNLLEWQWSFGRDPVDAHLGPHIVENQLTAAEQALAFAHDVAKGTPAYLSAVGEVVVDHTRCAINNPLPVIAGVALTAVSLEAAVAMLLTDLLANHEERINDVREFCRLVKENTSKSLAQATVLIGELYFLHTATQAFSPILHAAKGCVTEAFTKLGSCASREFVFAAESAGGVQPVTPTVNMLKKVVEKVEAIEERGVAAAKESLEIIAKNQLETSFTPKPVHYVPNVPKFCQSTVAGKFQTIEYELKTLQRSAEVANFSSTVKPTTSQIYAFTEQWAPGKNKTPVLNRKGTKIIGWDSIELSINSANGQRVITTKTFRFPTEKPQGATQNVFIANLEEYIIEQPMDKPIPANTKTGFNWKTNLHIEVEKE